MQDVKERVKQIIFSKSTVTSPESEELEDYDLIQDLGYHSVLFIELILELESIFKIEFELEFLAISNMSTVNKIGETVEDILQKNGVWEKGGE